MHLKWGNAIFDNHFTILKKYHLLVLIDPSKFSLQENPWVGSHSILGTNNRIRKAIWPEDYTKWSMESPRMPK